MHQKGNFSRFLNIHLFLTSFLSSRQKVSSFSLHQNDVTLFFWMLLNKVLRNKLFWLFLFEPRKLLEPNESSLPWKFRTLNLRKLHNAKALKLDIFCDWQVRLAIAERRALQYQVYIFFSLYLAWWFSLGLGRSCVLACDVAKLRSQKWPKYTFINAD